MSVISIESHDLAINGGQKLGDKPFPGRELIGKEDKAAVDELFDRAIADGGESVYLT